MDPMDIWLHLDTIEQQAVEELRELVYEYAQAHQDEIDFEDVQRRIASPTDVQNGNLPEVTVKDWMLKRLLICAKPPLKPAAALDKFVDIFRFRTQWNVARLTLQNTLPSEFFKVVPFIAEGVDRNGYKLLITRFKFYRKLPQFDYLIKRAMIYLLEQEDINYEKHGQYNGVTLLMDFQEFNYFANTNLEMLSFLVQLGFKFPGNIRSILLYSLPWALKMFVTMAEKLVYSFAGQKLVTFHSIDKSNIHQFIEPNQLPFFLEGTRPLKREVPETAVPLLQMVQSISEVDHKNALKIHNYVTSELL